MLRKAKIIVVSYRAKACLLTTDKMYKNYINKPDILNRYVYKILLVMRLTTVILIASMLQVSASSLAQKFSYVKKDVPLLQVFKELKKQTGYNILWNEKEMNVTTLIDANFKKSSIEEVMDACLVQLPFSYTINDKMVLIKQKELSFRDKVISFLAAIDVRGRVLDENDVPLVGAVVKVKGTKQATSTNSNGDFVLNVVDEKATLVISFLGYETKEIAASKNVGGIKLILNIDRLQEVQINAGYYTVTDRERTGNITKVTAATIEKQPISNPLQALQGRVPGVVIEQLTGVPGGGFNVQIRGRSSINPLVGNNPLYIIDGVNYPSITVSSGTSTGIFPVAGSNPLSAINPYDIESIEILKDADATAIYGSRGANGVVLITTKRGKIGDTKISAGISQGFNKVAHRLDLLNTQEYLDMRKEAFKNDGLTPSTTDYDINGTWNQNKYTDWQKELIGGTANTTNASLNISGGSGKSNYLFGANYYNEGTVFPGSFGFKRVAIHSNLNFTSTNDRFTAGFTASYSRTKSNLMRSDITSQILLSPNAPDPYDQYGNLNWENGTFPGNPMAFLLKTNNSGADNLVSNLNLSYRIFKSLTFKTSLGYTTIRQNELAKTPLASISPSSGPTAANRISDSSNNYNNSFITESQLSYATTIGLGQLNCLVGTTFQEDKREINTIRATGFNSDELMENPLSASTLRANGFNYSQYRYLATYLRLNYSLQNKYIINLTARRDGSSRFGDGKQFANFGAVGAAWIFSEEDKIKEKLSFLSLGKLRVSYGITGNDQIPDYGYLQSWGSMDTYQGLSTISPTRIANPIFAWEINKKTEIALQLGFLNDKITLESVYYRNRSSNQLVPMPLSLSTGNGSIQANLPAVVQNTGWEFLTNIKLLNKVDVQWSLGLNLSIPKNKLISYPGGIENSSYSLTYAVGEPLTISKVYNVRGVNSQTGLYDIEDLDGNGVLNGLDRYVIKFLGQKYYGGFQSSFSYKHFTFDFLLSYNNQTGLNYMNGILSPGYFDSVSPTTNQPSVVLERWQQAGDQSNIQKFSTSFGSATQYLRATSSTGGGLSITDASYIRLKNISLSYNLPEKILNGLKIKGAKLTIQGQNVFTITNYIGLDPETRRMNFLPPLRALSLSLNFTL